MKTVFEISTKAICCSAVALLYCLPLQAQMEVTFAIRHNDHNFLRYNYYHNAFDSALIYATIGEFVLHHSGGSTKLPLRYYPEPAVISGSDAQGTDSVLMNASRTVAFVMPPGTARLSFFRRMSVSAIPKGTDNRAASLPLPQPLDVWWHIGKGKVVDQTEFQLQLVRKSTNELLCVFDSAGTLPNPTSHIVPRYGTYPDQMNHSRFLPVGFAGDSVYIRILPRRFGSEFGMAMRQYASYYSYSTLYEYSDSTIFRQSFDMMDTMDALYWAQTKAYYDSMVAATGKLPVPMLHTLPPGHENEYTARYLLPNDTIDGLVHYTPKTATLPKPVVEEEYEVRNGKLIEKVHALALPNPVFGGKMSLTLISPADYTNVNANLYSALGKEVMKIWQGKLPKGKSSCVLHTAALPSGTYFLLVRDESGGILSRQSIIIE